jgi:hypothetical protein
MDLGPGRPLDRGRGSRLLLTGPLVGTVGLGDLEKVTPRRVVVLSMRGLRLSRVPAGTAPAGDPGSLDLSEAPERLCDLFNHEGAILTMPCFCSE